MRRRAHFTDIVIGLQLDDGDQGVYLPGEEADLSPQEFQQLRNAWFEEVHLLGLPMKIEGTIVRCVGCKHLWRRSPALNQLRVCAECAMADVTNTAAQRHHLKLS